MTLTDGRFIHVKLAPPTFSRLRPDLNNVYDSTKALWVAERWDDMLNFTLCLKDGL